MDSEEKLDGFRKMVLILKNLEDHVAKDNLETGMQNAKKTIADMEEFITNASADIVKAQEAIKITEALKQSLEMLIKLAETAMKVPSCKNCSWRFKCTKKIEMEAEGSIRCEHWLKEARS